MRLKEPCTNTLREGVECLRQQELQIKQNKPSVMVQPRRTLFDYERPQLTGDEFSVQAPTVSANNFEIKTSIIE